MKHLQSSPSLHSLVSVIVHHVVTPILLARQLRGGQSTGNLKMKIQLAWLYILDSSQACFPPPMKVDMRTSKVNGIITVAWMLDPEMFGVKTLPYSGLDTKLTKLLILFAHTYQLPGMGKVSVHRTKQGTAS